MDQKKIYLSKDDPRFRITPFQQMAASCTGGIITSLTMTPLDVVKVRLHAQQNAANVDVVRKCFLYCNGLMDHICPCLSSETSIPTQPYWYNRPSQFTGTLDAFIKISRNEGITSLWSGLSPTLVLALPATIIYFTVYEQLRSRLKVFSERKYQKLNGNNFKGQTPQPYWVPLIAGVAARTGSVTIVSPLELIRTKMQSEKLNYFQMNKAIRSLINYHGIIGLWKGVLPSLLRDVPFSGIYWVSYEKIKSLNSTDNNIKFTHSFISGGISGAIAALVTNPFDVVKTLHQIDFMEKQIFTGRGSITFINTLQKIYRENGIAGWYSGLIPRLIKVVPACAIMVASFEMGKQYFYERNVDKYTKRKVDCNNNEDGD